TAQIVILGTDDVAALTTAQIHALGTSDIAALTTDQIQALHTHDIVAMSTDQIHALTTAQIQALHTLDIVALTTSQIQALTTADVVALTTAQFHAMETADIAAMTTSQIVALETSDIAVMHTDGNTSAFTPEQAQALTSTQLDAFLTSPIVLDLDANGIQTVGAHNGVNFDITSSGHAIQTGWVAGNDGILVRDLNHDGAINDGRELFGTSTILASGAHAKDGFEALRTMDTNHDGVINMTDSEFKDLQIWVDSNHDGISSISELHSLQSLGVAQLNLDVTQTAVNNNGNWIFQDATYTATDGTTHQMADVWFEKGAEVDIITMTTAQIAELTPDQVHTLSTDQIHAMTPEQVAAFSTADVAVLSQDQVQALTLDDVAALQEFGKTDAFTATQLQAMIKPHLEVPGLDDVLFFGNVDVQTHAIAGSDQLQLIVTGDATGKVELIGQAGDWKDAGTMLVNGAESHVYNNGHIEIVIQGSVTALEKNLLIG
ncbi:MAG: hypothetical protein HGB35_03525, partial [Geobacteraceae bacterium]|nr:hypothetical protein [Geobacteraceae bacterium]